MFHSLRTEPDFHMVSPEMSQSRRLCETRAKLGLSHSSDQRKQRSIDF